MTEKNINFALSKFFIKLLRRLRYLSQAAQCCHTSKPDDLNELNHVQLPIKLCLPVDIYTLPKTPALFVEYHFPMPERGVRCSRGDILVHVRYSRSYPRALPICAKVSTVRIKRIQQPATLHFVTFTRAVHIRQLCSGLRY